VQLYLYSCQDLIIFDCNPTYIKAGIIYNIKVNSDDNIVIYCATNSGVIYLSLDILLRQEHNQIIFHKISPNSMLCEIKPFISKFNVKNYSIDNANIELVYSADGTYIFFNNSYYGYFKCKIIEDKFKKINYNNVQIGIIQLQFEKRYIILFNANRIIYCGQYIDIETTKQYVQVYNHVDNMFNIGNLIKYSFDKDVLEIKAIKDRGEERKQNNNDFNIIYFLEAIKCGRFKYAYDKLSYELKTHIDIDTLSNYFSNFDKYIYLHNEEAYITIKNNKVIGIYHFVVKDNLIDNIY